MARPSAPSMPTPTQIKDAWEAVKQINPAARIVSVGPDGVRFDYGIDEAGNKRQAGPKRYGEK
ncbi:hypothetical protein GGQ68_002480 [Sagittula marina]|uniref:Uncharacterized protein n=1 Tax=Sagittula marina TaxID=943940 RepID=A0A7W6DSK8_9RHOB|nr:hypothetical protein [Sagittula marina]MBB3986142.1 hypothetical protein [Sagittula marina]